LVKQDSLQDVCERRYYTPTVEQSVGILIADPADFQLNLNEFDVRKSNENPESSSRIMYSGHDAEHACFCR